MICSEMPRSYSSLAPQESGIPRNFSAKHGGCCMLCSCSCLCREQPWSCCENHILQRFAAMKEDGSSGLLGPALWMGPRLHCIREHVEIGCVSA